MFDDFTQTISEHWTQTRLGKGTLSVAHSALRLSLPSTPAGEYGDAQIDDYGHLARKHFPWRPPLRMEVRARSSLPAATAMSTSESDGLLRGTAGFGFWNYPFSVRGDVLMLPEALWFFYASPPSNMALVPHVPGWGWKAQVVHSMRPGALLSAVPLALSTAYGLFSQNTQPAAHWLQRVAGAQEALLPVALPEWHTYVLEWRDRSAQFWVDGQRVLQVPHPPTRPLGFVAWLDNQYAIATPRGVLRFGTVATPEEWFEIDSIQIDRL
jgi:hypothetical protein